MSHWALMFLWRPRLKIESWGTSLRWKEGFLFRNRASSLASPRMVLNASSQQHCRAINLWRTATCVTHAHPVLVVQPSWWTGRAELIRAAPRGPRSEGPGLCPCELTEVTDILHCSRSSIISLHDTSALWPTRRETCPQGGGQGDTGVHPARSKAMFPPEDKSSHTLKEYLHYYTTLGVNDKPMHKIVWL